MVEESKENTFSVSLGQFKRQRESLLEVLAEPGGGTTALTDKQREELEILPSDERAIVKSEGQAVMRKKLMEMDSLIIKAAIHNLQASCQNMCGLNTPIVMYARSLLLEKNNDFDRLVNKDKGIKEPFDLSFLVDVESVAVESELVKADPLPHKQARMTRGDYQMVQKLRGQGMSIREIAETTGWSKTRVGRIAKEV